MTDKIETPTPPFKHGERIEGEDITYVMTDSSKPITMHFELDILEWHILFGMLCAVSDHAGVGKNFADQFQKNMTRFAGLIVP